VSGARPFEFEIIPVDGPQSRPCVGDTCAPFRAEVRVWIETPGCDNGMPYNGGCAGGAFLALCRDCLRRMRATLKAAEKALPVVPKPGKGEGK